MATLQVGMREFRENMSSYVVDAKEPVAITRHGDTIGYFLPVKQKLTKEEWAALDESSTKLQRELERLGLTEDMLMEDIQRLHKEKKAERR